MDDRDAWAASQFTFRACVGAGAIWGLWLLPLQLIGGLTRANAIFLASMGLGAVVVLHLLRMVFGRGRTAAAGVMAGLGTAEMWEVMAAVREGRRVSDVRLAGPAVDHARQQLRRESFFRVALPAVLVLRVVTLAADPPRLTGRVVASGAVQVVQLLAFWGLVLRTCRRAADSEEANWRLIEGGGAR